MKQYTDRKNTSTTLQKPVSAHFRNQVSKSSRKPDFANPLLVTEDWTDLRNVESLCRRAGVSRELIPCVVVKELVDNALDASDEVEFGPMADGWYFVANAMNGLDLSPAEVAEFFSIRRARASSKRFRLPTRGTLGHGTRVVTGGVFASGGQLRVCTKGRAIELRMREDGHTEISRDDPWDGQGTRIEFKLGETFGSPTEEWDEWACEAKLLADIQRDSGRQYGKTKTSAYWFESDGFYELLQALSDSPVRLFVDRHLEGCASAKAGEIAAPFKGRTCGSLTRIEADQLLARARRVSDAVTPSRLGRVGKSPELGHYANATGFRVIKAAQGKIDAHVPFVVESWALPASKPSLRLFVNGTPVTTRAHVERGGGGESSDYHVVVAGRYRPIKVGKKNYSIRLNIITPYMPITTDGKAPDLLSESIWEAIASAVEKSIRIANRSSPARTGRTYKQIVLANLQAATAKVSGGKHRYSLRQLFYALRPWLISELGKEPSWGTFCRVITDIERARGGDLPGIYRDNRGILYHPHSGEEIPIGTRRVEEYKRPTYLFRRVLFCEKEGLFPALIDDKWPERYDCALLTGKGYATRAVKDLLDILGDGAKEIVFFAIHDSDGYGTRIRQTLIESTPARDARRVKIIDLGLNPWEGVAMGLESEKVEPKKGRKITVADDIPQQWKDWLQCNRIELNSMTTPQFIAWLDSKMAEHGATEKLIPPKAVQADELRARVKQQLHDRITAEAIRSFDVDGRVQKAMRSLSATLAKTTKSLSAAVGKDLARRPTDSWRESVGRVAVGVAAKGG